MYKTAARAWQRIRHIIKSTPIRRGKGKGSGRGKGGKGSKQKLFCNWSHDDVRSEGYEHHLRLEHNLTGSIHDIMREANPATSLTYHQYIKCRCTQMVQKGFMTVH